jgi:peptidyl-prolyl cis-trans isomerase SurA
MAALAMRNALIAAALLLFPLAAHAELVDRIAAVVNRDIIALSEVEGRAAPELLKLRNEPDAARRAQKREAIMKTALDGLIAEKLMESQLREFNIEVTETDLDLAIEDVKRQNNNMDDATFTRMLMSEGYTLATYRGFMRKHLARLKLINFKVRGKVRVSDEDLKAEYAKQSKEESQDFEVHARHILVKVLEKATPEQVEAARVKALALAEEARKPGVDFAALAKEKSEGPSKDDGGDLNWFRRGVMVPEFERAAFSQPMGAVSEPIRTKFGWHVLKVEEKRGLSAKPFEDMKDSLRERLQRTQLERYTEQYVQELRAAAVVDVKI